MLRSLHDTEVDTEHPAHTFFYNDEGEFRWWQFEVKPDWRIIASFLVTVYVREP